MKETLQKLSRTETNLTIESKRFIVEDCNRSKLTKQRREALAQQKGVKSN